MAQTEIIPPPSDIRNARRQQENIPASGLFGYSICEGQMRSLKPTEGYLRDIEQMPHFAPPSASRFSAQYLASNIGKTRSSS